MGHSKLDHSPSYEESEPVESRMFSDAWRCVNDFDDSLRNIPERYRSQPHQQNLPAMIPARRLLAPVTRRSTYYQSDYTQGPALVRARRPFLVKNVLTGAAMVALTASIYTYTIKAVAQDDFEDVLVPDAPTQKPVTSGTGANAISTGPLAK